MTGQLVCGHLQVGRQWCLSSPPALLTVEVFFFIIIYFVSVSVLPECVYVYHQVSGA